MHRHGTHHDRNSSVARWEDDGGPPVGPAAGSAPKGDCDVRLDYAGFGGHARYTCYSCRAVIGTTCLRQPWMDEQTWDRRKAAFFARHPAHNIGRA